MTGCHILLDQRLPTPSPSQEINSTEIKEEMLPYRLFSPGRKSSGPWAP